MFLRYAVTQPGSGKKEEDKPPRQLDDRSAFFATTNIYSSVGWSPEVKFS